MKLVNDTALDWLKALAYIASLVVGAAALPFVATAIGMLLRYLLLHIDPFLTP